MEINTQYRIVEFKNGLGHYIYSAEWSWKFWPFWHTVKTYELFDLEFETLDDANLWIKNRTEHEEYLKQIRKRLKIRIVKP